MSAVRQLRLLVALRWRMVRSRRVRRLMTLGLVALPVLVAVAAIGGQVAPSRKAFEFALLEPSALLGFAVLAIIGPLAAGGGYELYPDEHLVAFPVCPATRFLGSLALTPLNIAWVAQLIGLTALTAYTSPHRPGVALALVTAWVYAGATTLLGHALSWVVIGLRQRRSGRIITWAVAAAVGGSFTGVVAARETAALLDKSPTTQLVVVMLQSTTGTYGGWVLATVLLGACAVLFLLAGVIACGWALRRPGDTSTLSDARRVRRRPMPATPRAALVRTDWASVWRSVPIRRGLIVLIVLPAVAAVAARVEWSGLAVLPGLVASGAALLFGVNAFSLDDSGSIWLASLPHPPRLALTGKATAVAAAVSLPTIAVVIAGALRPVHAPTAAEVTAVISAAVVSLFYMVAICQRLSIENPYRAQLRGRRETPAPPGVMAGYSARLAVSITFIGLVFAGAGQSKIAWVPPVLAVPFVARSLRSMLATSREWDNPDVRARVAHSVAAG